MWSSFGSLRDRVRENALAARETARAAAVVAQGVLQAAAAEEDQQEQDTRPRADDQDDWGWGQPQQSRSDPSLRPSKTDDNLHYNDAPPPPLQPPPPPPSDDTQETLPPLPPPPPSGLAPAMSRPRTTKSRASRYVVTGLATSRSDPSSVQAAAPRPPGPPRPTLGAAPPADNDSTATDPFACEPPRDVPTDASVFVPPPPPPPQSEPPRDDDMGASLPAEPPRDDDVFAPPVVPQRADEVFPPPEAQSEGPNVSDFPREDTAFELGAAQNEAGPPPPPPQLAPLQPPVSQSFEPFGQGIAENEKKPEQDQDDFGDWGDDWEVEPAESGASDLFSAATPQPANNESDVSVQPPPTSSSLPSSEHVQPVAAPPPPTAPQSESEPKNDTVLLADPFSTATEEPSQPENAFLDDPFANVAPNASNDDPFKPTLPAASEEPPQPEPALLDDSFAPAGPNGPQDDPFTEVQPATQQADAAPPQDGCVTTSLAVGDHNILTDDPFSTTPGNSQPEEKRVTEPTEKSEPEATSEYDPFATIAEQSEARAADGTETVQSHPTEDGTQNEQNESAFPRVEPSSPSQTNSLGDSFAPSEKAPAVSPVFDDDPFAVARPHESEQTTDAASGEIFPLPPPPKHVSGPTNSLEMDPFAHPQRDDENESSDPFDGAISAAPKNMEAAKGNLAVDNKLTNSEGPFAQPADVDQPQSEPTIVQETAPMDASLQTTASANVLPTSAPQTSVPDTALSNVDDPFNLVPPAAQTAAEQGGASKENGVAPEDASFAVDDGFDAWEPVVPNVPAEEQTNGGVSQEVDWFSTAPDQEPQVPESFPGTSDQPALTNSNEENPQEAANLRTGSEILTSNTQREQTSIPKTINQPIQNVEQRTPEPAQSSGERQSSSSDAKQNNSVEGSGEHVQNSFDANEWDGYHQPNDVGPHANEPQPMNWREFSDAPLEPIPRDSEATSQQTDPQNVADNKMLHRDPISQETMPAAGMDSFSWDSTRAIQQHSVPHSDYSREIAELQEQIKSLTIERDSAISSKSTSDDTSSKLQNVVDQLRADVEQRSSELRVMTEENQVLRKEQEVIAEEKLIAEKERDAALERGGDGIREARNALEEMNSNKKSAEIREAAISQQNETLRTDLERASEERNQLIADMNDVRSKLSEYETVARAREEELSHQLKLANSEAELARLEKEKALESADVQYEQFKELQELEQTRLASLMASEARVKELEVYVNSSRSRDEDESMRLEAFSKQVEEMSERTQGVIEERNIYYSEKIALESTVEALRAEMDGLNRAMSDIQRESASLKAERDEAKQACATLREQLKEESSQSQAIAAERDRLVQERTTMASKSTSVSDKERALSQECEQKTRAVGMLQRKLQAAAAKIEKVTNQRGTFQRQRDEAGARLRAAGAEFVTLNEKLQALTTARDDLQQQVITIRDERDDALTRVEEFGNLDTQLKIYKESTETKERELEQLRAQLKESQQESTKAFEEHSSLQQQYTTVSKELQASEGRMSILEKEKQLVEERHQSFEGDIKKAHKQVQEAVAAKNEALKKAKTLELELTTANERSSRDLEKAKADLSTADDSRVEIEEKVTEVREELHNYSVAMDSIRSAVVSCMRSGKSRLEALSHGDVVPQWPDIPSTMDGSEGPKEVVELVTKCCDATLNLCGVYSRALQTSEASASQHQDLVYQVQALEQEKNELLRLHDDIARLTGELEQSRNHYGIVYNEREGLQAACNDLDERLRLSLGKEGELQERIEMLKVQMNEEIQRNKQEWAEQKYVNDQSSEQVASKLMSIWGMLQKSMGSEQAESMLADTEYEEDDGNNVERVGVLALRATASIVAEVDRRRGELQELQQKLASSEAEVSRQDERAEIAERERDASKGTNERLEHRLESARQDGLEEARNQYEPIVSQLEDDLQDTRNELSAASDRLRRAEKESGELRALCSKLTSQVNGRTNELDEAEERVVYLQDQVTSLEEDLEEAHARLKQSESELGEARRTDVERLTKDVEDKSAQLESLEGECARLREACEAAEKVAKESESMAETHRKAEENLQIAIEQLEAGQDKLVEQRTKDLEGQMEDARKECALAKEGEAAAKVTQEQLGVRDEEIKELRQALGRLSDERVELKLELEKCLSRMNHPDAGGQLVDRRVVRQLLVSYFRVGSVRRRDVLELMSRMLAFSDSDNVAVGLKRRALMDRLGSLVQAPEMEDAQLPPLGTVSGKWIEFLMKETEEEEDNGSGW